jgi:pyruvate formate lyase activating enzyme
LTGAAGHHTRARWFERHSGSAVRCLLCPRGCVIPDGESGYCGARANIGGTLIALSYGRPVALQVDPIEKKPLAEFLPGTKTFSIGSYGCNLGCLFCQNSHLSRGRFDSSGPGTGRYAPPEAVPTLAVQHGCKSVAFTYNEPTVFAEYAIDVAKEAKRLGLATVLVSNGYISRPAAEELYPLIDAANIDMKGFSEEFYRDMAAGSLQPVLEAMEYYHSIGGHLEITNLVIPGKNDSPEMIGKFLDWTEQKLGKDTPLHFSAYHPDWKYFDSPPTPPDTLRAIKKTAAARGFNHVYLGNIW